MRPGGVWGRGRPQAGCTCALGSGAALHFGVAGGLAAEPCAPRRYVVEAPRLPLAARLKPPFFRPELLERAGPLKVKLSDNGLKAGLGRSKVGAGGGG